MGGVKLVQKTVDTHYQMLGSSYTYKSWRCVGCRKLGREINQGGIVAQRLRLQDWLDPYATKVDSRRPANARPC